MATTEFTSSSYLADYLSPDPTDHPLPIDQDPFSRPMSPVQSAASTPPLANHNSTLRTMASFASPVSMSSAPYGMPMPPTSFPRRAEHSYAQNYMPHPYTMGAPPRGPQLPSASLLQPQPPSTYVPDVPSSAPDAPPSGTGGSRKRPKYTRSKKGCLTCRSKKIKCDERKPLCTRCEHGHRECTWPETVLPRRPKGAVRGVGNEDDDEEEEHAGDDRRASIPGSAVSSHFPSSTTSSHFPGIGNNSPFDTAPPRRDAFDSDGYTNGSQFPLPVLPANARQFYPRAPGSAPSGEFYPVTTVNGQPIDEYEFPPRQTFGAGSSSSGGGPLRGSYSNTNGNGSLYANGPPGSIASYNADLRRASWDSNAPTDGRRPSWDAGSLAVSSASSPTTSSLGLGLGGLGRAAGGSGATTSAGSSAGGAGGSSASGAGPGLPGGSLMLFQSPDPLSPFFRSVQERNLVGNISSFTPSSTPPFTSSPFSSASSSFLSRPPSEYGVTSAAAAAAATAYGYMSSSPVLSSASSTEFGVTPEGLPYRKNSYPHLYPPPRALTLDPPAPVISPAMNIASSPTSLSAMAMAESGGSKSNSDVVDWLAPPAPAMDVYRPSSSSAWTAEGDEYVSWDAYS